jgi:ATP-dependent protease HslVU (ClpYQ) peptidase subunit
MSTRLKLTDSVVFNADNILYVTGRTDRAEISYYIASTGKGNELAAAINKALVSNPGGRVLTVPAGDYTVGAVTISEGV